MTDFGRRSGDMKKSVYDTDGDGVVDDAEKLESETLSQVQDHTPQAHTHTEAQITDLDHDALKVVGVPVDDTDKGNTKVLAYNSTTQKLEYEAPGGGGHTLVDRGDPAAFDWEVGDFTTDATWRDLDCSSIVPANAVAIVFKINITCASAGGSFFLRKNGITNATSAVGCVEHGLSGGNTNNPTVFCDANRFVEYYVSNLTWSAIRLVVLGWWI